MNIRSISILIALIFLAGCSVRSISDSGYSGRGYYRGGSNPMYQGELSEFDVLGVDPGAEISEDDIKKALQDSPSRKLIRKGSPIMLIQSGAMIPDQEMVDHLEKSFSVSVFTGVPETEKTDNASYSKSLRLAAAKAGIETIIVYWGVLESGVENLATNTVSWVPIVGSVIPDETQKMRIRLKVAVIDVLSGKWEIFSPKAFDDKTYSARLNREGSDQAQVAKLKKLAYEQAATDVVARFVK